VLRTALLAAAAALAACAGPRTRTGTTLPDNIRKLAILPIVNKTQQPGLEDQLALAVRDEFLRDARHPLVPQSESDADVLITVTRYILTPLQYDSNLNPATYRLHVALDVQLVDRAAGKTVWDEKGLEASLSYPYVALTGGLSEDAARQNLWAILSPMVVGRVVDGFGATGPSTP
jgi:hypothetical protein